MFKNKVADFLMLANQGYDSMSAKEVALWYLAAVPANVVYFKLIRRRKFAPAIAIASMMVGALVLRSFALGLRLRNQRAPAPMWEPAPSNGAVNTKIEEEPLHGSWIFCQKEGRFVQVCTDPDAPSCEICGSSN